MARRDEKPMLPAAEEKLLLPCADGPQCRYPGLIWVSTLPHDKRFCIHHYYDAIDRNPYLKRDDSIPPKPRFVDKKLASSGE